VQPTLRAPWIWTLSCGVALPRAVSAATVAKFSGPHIQTGPRHDVSVRERNDPLGEIRRDVLETLDDGFAAAACNDLKRSNTGFVSLFLMCHHRKTALAVQSRMHVSSSSIP
jgi:hypothetical protein